ncbi:unnamed protein product, partial [Closterium sp. NIES-54]
MPTHRAVKGSVSDYLLHNCSCPVLVVPWEHMLKFKSLSSFNARAATSTPAGVVSASIDDDCRQPAEMTAVGDDGTAKPADRQFRRKYALTDVLRTSAGLEYSVHSCPRQYKQDMESLFPGQDVSKLLILPTQQRARVDLVNTGEEVEKEKDRLLETFAAFASALVERLSQQGHFADYIDPCSGLP